MKYKGRMEINIRELKKKELLLREGSPKKGRWVVLDG